MAAGEKTADSKEQTTDTPEPVAKKNDELSAEQQIVPPAQQGADSSAASADHQVSRMFYVKWSSG